ncbi:dihydroxyacetone kinase-like protein [Haloactinopolyspora alba]|uniref:Dihydroxyacetone kinase-like protein n=1 Tax=Haloactinopolyspora alba TaxID=648780 RepID=A0A2P8DJ41_9ACTN|nr:dihydroxyacetone kinase subunit DhaL [Haloactinopolyspora alba]PSK97240.1 dihydroxyacetone kinase-like protein [Haloactinopolyspora alba]
MNLDTRTAVAWITRAADDVRADEARLTSLDAAVGDGDHGANMTRGLAAATASFAEKPPATPGAVLVAAGRSLVAKTGGASGPLYGTGLRKAGKALGEAEQAEPAAVAEALQAMLDGIRELGEAAEGDKTMIDALAPAVAAFRDAVDDGADLGAAARAAADAAEEGLAATVPLQARKGRASYLGARSVGHEDPGAASTTLVLRALAEVTTEDAA